MKKYSLFDPAIVEKSMVGLRVPSSIGDPDAEMLEYSNVFFRRLESVGYENFKDENPKMTVKLLQKHVYPRRFTDAMQKSLEYQETLSKDLVAYECFGRRLRRSRVQ